MSQMVFREPNTIGANKWFVAVDLIKDGETHYLHLDGEVKRLTDAQYVLFKSKELAEEAIKKYNKVIRIGGE